MYKTCTLLQLAQPTLSPLFPLTVHKFFNTGGTEDEHKQAINRVLLVDGEKAPKLEGSRNVCKEMTSKPDSARDSEIKEEKTKGAGAPHQARTPRATWPGNVTQESLGLAAA